MAERLPRIGPGQLAESDEPRHDDYQTDPSSSQSALRPSPLRGSPMKVSLPTPALLDAVGHGSAVASSKSPNPVLECLALRAERGGGLSIEATDLDVGLRLRIEDAEVAEPGTLVVPAARLLSIVREIDQERTTLAEVEGRLAIDSGRSHFEVRG